MTDMHCNSEAVPDNGEHQKALTRITRQRNIFMAISSILFIIIIAATAILCKLFVLGSIAPTWTINTVNFEVRDEKIVEYEFALWPESQVINGTTMTAPDEFGNIYIQVKAVLLSPLNTPYTRESMMVEHHDQLINGVYLQGKNKNDIVVLWEKE